MGSTPNFHAICGWHSSLLQEVSAGTRTLLDQLQSDRGSVNDRNFGGFPERGGGGGGVSTAEMPVNANSMQ